MSRASQRTKKSNPKYSEDNADDIDLEEQTSMEDIDPSSPEDKKTNRNQRKSKKHARDEDEDHVETTKRRKESPSQDVSERRRVEYAKHLDDLMQKTMEGIDDPDSDEEAAGSDLKLTRSSMEAGQIVEMYLENFMCHRKFTMQFCKNVNFISGKNGSGKSSIVSALQVCLGSTAKTAGRGSKMDEYIREGSAGPAIIKVTMINEGPDAFSPEIYGKRITVERRIARTSGSCYILHDENGREVSRKKSDLEKMLQMFNIYVDNPCNVMTQEESKKFIRAKNTDKYTFFLKATGLNRLKEDLEDINKDIVEAEGQAEKQTGRIEQKAQSVKEIEDLLTKMKELDTMEDRIRTSRAKMYWDDLRVATDELSGVEAELEEKEKQFAQAEAAYQKSLNVNNTAEEDVARIQEVIEELTKESEDIDTQMSTKQSEISKSNADLRAVKADLTKLESTRDEYMQRKKVVERQITELRQKALQNAEADTRGIVERMTAIEGTLRADRQEENELRAKKSELDRSIPQAENAVRRSGGEISALKGQIAEQQRELRNLQQSGSDRSSTFPNPVNQFKQTVQQRRGELRDQVYGPLGMHLSIKEEYSAQYERAIERALGRAVFAFVVTNHEDRRTLQGWLSANPAAAQLVQVIMQSPAAKYSVPSLPPHVVTALMTLQMDHDILYNVLVDQFSLERVALVKRSNDAIDQYVERSGSMKKLKYDLQSVIDNEDCDVLTYRSGNASNDPNRYGFHGYLSKDLSAVLEARQQEIRLREERIREIEAQQRSLQEDVRALKHEDAQVIQRLRAISDALRQNQRQRDVLQQKLEEVSEATRIDTSGQEQERAELEAAIEDIVLKLPTVQEQLKTLTTASKTLALAKKDLDAQKSRIDARIQEQHQEIERLLKDRANEKRKAETLKKRMEEKQKEVDSERKKVERARGVVDAARQAAEEQTRSLLPAWNGEALRLTRNENRATLDRLVRELQAKFNAAKREAGLQGYSLEILQERYDKAHDELVEMTTVFETLQSNIEALVASQKEREKKWSRALKHCTKVVKAAFDSYASRRGSAGTVRFDHRAGTLDIQVQVDSADEHSVANDIMNLSGGERSYVTFCLQLALGHVIECPFRLLDEYDVFMDEATRSLSLQMMQRYALERPDQRQRQFLILTPHRMNEVTPTRQVKVLFMPEPQRISAQGPQQQTL